MRHPRTPAYFKTDPECDGEGSIRHERAPSEPQLVYRRDPQSGRPVEGHLIWGLIPQYADRRPDFRPIHARAETINEQKLFREAYRKRRCVVPMNAVFQKDTHGKRHTIARVDGELFAVAGIWENWRNPETLKWERTFAIITVPANAVVAAIHDRMPAIIDRNDIPRWLSLEENPHDLLRPFADELICVKPVAGRGFR